MKENPKISIIIPVYNAALYLQDCVNSILNQDYTDYEILLIDDGSQDKSGEICDVLAKEYAKIQVVHQKNQGASKARNTGLDLARGEFVWFIDADDFISAGCLCHLIQKMNDNQLDFLSFGLQDYNVDGTPSSVGNVLHKPDKIITGREYLQQYEVECSSCTFIFRRSIAEQYHIRLMEHVTLEDYEFPVHLLLHCNWVTSLKDICYHYRNNAKSTSRRKSVDFYSFRISCWLRIIERLEYLEKESGIDIAGVKGLNAYRLLLLLLFSNLSKSEKRKNFKLFNEKKIFQYARNKEKLYAYKHKICASVLSMPFIYHLFLIIRS